MQSVLESRELGSALGFALEMIKDLDLKRLQQFFENLPADPYLKDRYRFRRLSRFKVTPTRLSQLPHGCLFQSKQYNPLLGDLKREFAELEDELIQLDALRQLIAAFIVACQLDPVMAEIGVHQIRTTCSAANPGNPAPEGIHCDGAEFIGIFSVSRANIWGGQTHLYTAKTQAPVFSKVLYPGELLLVNDREFLHFTTPIQPAAVGVGSRDVFVLTCPSLLT